MFRQETTKISCKFSRKTLLNEQTFNGNFGKEHKKKIIKVYEQINFQ